MQWVDELRYRLLMARRSAGRYRNLYRTVYETRPRCIVEIGTWNGARGGQLIRIAARHRPVGEIRYVGFDLFEELTDELYALELSKRPPPFEAVKTRLEATGAAVTLVRGNTRETLPRSAALLRDADFVFIDGGHSIETIRSDWTAVAGAVPPSATVLFDDYYVDAGPELEGLGCQSIVEALDRSRYRVEVLDPVDRFPKPWGELKVRMARVTHRAPAPAASGAPR